MINQGKILYRGIGGIVIVALFISAVVVTFVTESHSNISATNQFMQFLVDQHIWIMASLVIMSTVFGFFWSHVLYQQVKSTVKTTKSISELIYEFLSIEEKKVINFLLKHDGKSSQSSISRIEGMNKVKAYRTVQKMGDKGLVKIVAEGKIRRIILRKDLAELLEIHSE